MDGHSLAGAGLRPKNPSPGLRLSVARPQIIPSPVLRPPIAGQRRLTLKPDLAEAWFNKSLALGHLQRQDESVSCCDRVLALDPRHLNALLQKARALHRLGRDAEARACGEQMQRIDPVAASKLLNKI